MTHWTFKFRRAEAYVWALKNPVLSEGEPGVESDTDKLKIGDGETPWTELGYVGNDLTNAELEVLIRETLGEVQQSGAVVADVISTPGSPAHLAVADVVSEETDPVISLVLLFENAKV